MYIKIQMKGKSFWWTLRGSNNKIFATSETFSSVTSLQHAVTIVQREIKLRVFCTKQAKATLIKKGIPVA